MQCSGALWSFVDNEPHAKLLPHSLGQKKISENPPARIFLSSWDGNKLCPRSDNEPASSAGEGPEDLTHGSLCGRLMHSWRVILHLCTAMRRTSEKRKGERRSWFHRWRRGASITRELTGVMTLFLGSQLSAPIQPQRCGRARSPVSAPADWVLGRCGGTEAWPVCAPLHRWHFTVNYMSQVSRLLKEEIGDWFWIIPSSQFHRRPPEDGLRWGRGRNNTHIWRSTRMHFKDGSMSERPCSDSAPVWLTHQWNGTGFLCIIFKFHTCYSNKQKN